MKTLLLGLSAAAATLVATVPAEAQVNQRQWRQQERIQNGVRRGDLTRNEYYRLQRQQARIDRYEDRSRWDDGRLSYNERRRLDRMQDRASRNIYRQKNDWQDRRRW